MNNTEKTERLNEYIVELSERYPDKEWEDIVYLALRFTREDAMKKEKILNEIFENDPDNILNISTEE